MDNLLSIVDDLIVGSSQFKQRKGNYIQVSVDRFGRTQRVHVTKRRDEYVLSSVVARISDLLGTDSKHRTLLLKRIWTRNALKPLVNLNIDGRDRIVGSISVPVGQESPSSIAFYLENLARECDRFEYILTGADEH